MKKLLILFGISVNILICQSIISVEPNSSVQGSSLWVTITGEGTYFVVTDTVGVSGNVDTVMINMGNDWIGATSFTALSETVLEAFFAIPEDATIGSYDVAVEQGMEYGSVSLANGFSIEESLSLSPDIIPTNHLLHQNFPNPFNPTTNISFRIANPSISSLIIYDLSGNLVRELKNGFIPEGEYNLTWDGRSAAGQSVASGLYIYQLKSNSYIATKKMLMIK